MQTNFKIILASQVRTTQSVYLYLQAWAHYAETHNRRQFFQCKLNRSFSACIPKRHLVGNEPRGSSTLIEAVPNVISQHNARQNLSIRNGPKSASRSLFKTINDAVSWMDHETKIFFGHILGGQDVRWIIEDFGYWMNGLRRSLT